MRGLALAYGLTAALAPRVALAGNVDSFYLSNDAPLQGGAITADARGGGSIWYNPAGLARMPGLRLDASASAYSLRVGGQPDISAQAEDSVVTRLETVDFQIVPSALTLTHTFSGVGAGFGVFVPNQHTTYLRTRIEQPPDDQGRSVDLVLDYYDRVQEYYGGPAIGVKLHPAVDFGASLFVHYRTRLAIGAARLHVESPKGTGDSLNHQTLDWQQVGLQMVFGVQLRPRRDWRLGLVLRTPSFRVFNVRQTVSVGTLTETVSGELQQNNPEPEFQEELGLDAAFVAPPRFHFCASHDLESTRLALDLSYQLPLRSPEVELDTRPVVNARVGVREQLSEKVALGGGVFSDRSPQRRQIPLGEQRVNYYGVTIALDLTAPYGIIERDGEQFSQAKSLDFGTTLALSYAFGLGELNQLSVGTDSGFLERRTDVRLHEFTVHFGGWLAE